MNLCIICENNKTPISTIEDQDECKFILCKNCSMRWNLNSSTSAVTEIKCESYLHAQYEDHIDVQDCGDKKRCFSCREKNKNLEAQTNYLKTFIDEY